jgi:hypothetical protein
MKRKEDEMTCPINYKRYRERMAFERICGCVITTLMDGTPTHIKFCKKHELEVNRLKKEEGRRAYVDRVLSIYLEN